MELAFLVALVVPPTGRGLFHLRVADLPLREPLAVRVPTDLDVVAAVLVSAAVLLVPATLETLLNLGEGVERVPGEVQPGGYPEVVLEVGVLP